MLFYLLIFSFLHCVRHILTFSKFAQKLNNTAVINVDPLFGYLNHENHVTIHGTNIPFLDTIKCRFTSESDFFTDSTWLFYSIAKCSVPELPIGIYSVSLCYGENKGDCASFSSAKYSIQTRVSISEATLLDGYVMVNGSHFTSEPDLTCQVYINGTTTMLSQSAALVFSDNALLCVHYVQWENVCISISDSENCIFLDMSIKRKTSENNTEIHASPINSATFIPIERTEEVFTEYFTDSAYVGIEWQYCINQTEHCTRPMIFNESTSSTIIEISDELYLYGRINVEVLPMSFTFKRITSVFDSSAIVRLFGIGYKCDDAVDDYDFKKMIDCTHNSITYEIFSPTDELKNSSRRFRRREAIEKPIKINVFNDSNPTDHTNNSLALIDMPRTAARMSLRRNLTIEIKKVGLKPAFKTVVDDRSEETGDISFNWIEPQIENAALVRTLMSYFVSSYFNYNSTRPTKSIMSGRNTADLINIYPMSVHTGSGFVKHQVVHGSDWKSNMTCFSTTKYLDACYHISKMQFQHQEHSRYVNKPLDAGVGDIVTDVLFENEESDPMVSIIDIQNGSLRFYVVGKLNDVIKCQFYPGRIIVRAIQRDYWYQCGIPLNGCNEVLILDRLYKLPESDAEPVSPILESVSVVKPAPMNPTFDIPKIVLISQNLNELQIEFSFHFPPELFFCNKARLSWISDTIAVCALFPSSTLVKLKYTNIILSVYSVNQSITPDVSKWSEIFDFQYDEEEIITDNRHHYLSFTEMETQPETVKLSTLVPMVCHSKPQYSYLKTNHKIINEAMSISKNEAIIVQSVTKQNVLPQVVNHYPKQFIADKVYLEFLDAEFDNINCFFNGIDLSSLIAINRTYGYCDIPDYFSRDQLDVQIANYNFTLFPIGNLSMTVSPNFLVSSASIVWLSIDFSTPIELSAYQVTCTLTSNLMDLAESTLQSDYRIKNKETVCAFSYDMLSSYPTAVVTIRDPFNKIDIYYNHPIEFHHLMTIYYSSKSDNKISMYGLGTILNPTIYRCQINGGLTYQIVVRSDNVYTCIVDRIEFVTSASICLLHDNNCVPASNIFPVVDETEDKQLFINVPDTINQAPLIDFTVINIFPLSVTSDTPWLFVKLSHLTDRSNLTCSAGNFQESTLFFINSTHGKCQIDNLFHQSGIYNVSVAPDKQFFHISFTFRNFILHSVIFHIKEAIVMIDSDIKVSHCRIGHSNVVEAHYLDLTILSCRIEDEFRLREELYLSFDNMHSWLRTGYWYKSALFNRGDNSSVVLHSLIRAPENTYEDIDIFRISPSHGPMSHSTIVNIHGVFRSNITMCRFGLASSFVIESEFSEGVEKISCVAPSTSRDSTVSVSLVSDSGTIFKSDLTFTYDEDVLLLSSTILDSNLMLLTGKNFIRTPDLSCIWNSGDRNGIYTTKAVYISKESLSCSLPQEIVDDQVESSLVVSTNALFYKSSSILVKPLPILSIQSIQPINGPAFRGGTIVTISVNSSSSDSTVKTTDLTCKFGQHMREATIVSSNDKSSVILCESPSHFNSTLVSFSLHGISGARLSGSEGMKFHYVLDHSVRNLVPSSSSVAGNIPVIVIGSNFLNTSSLGCMFGDIIVRAVFINPSVLTCIAPSRVGVPDASSVSVEVTNNGLDFSQSGIKFRYVTRSSSSSSGAYAYGLYSMTCPNGTFCQTAENSLATNFSLCSPGFFQPRSGQSACLPCPVGYYCPDSGLSRPIICSPGLVCDVSALITPIKSCPRGSYCMVGTKTFYLEDFVPVSTLTANRTGELQSASTSSISSGDWIYQEESGVVVFNISSSEHNWAYVSRQPLPEIGVHRFEHPPDLRSCGLSLDSSATTASRRCRNGVTDLTAEQPYPCPLGYYCRTGVSTDVPTPKNFSTPQRCFDGFFCPRGAMNPEGSGPCPTGYYCPSQTEALRCPVGYYCPGVGNTAPLQCYPGTYNPNLSQSNCTVCPTGHICPGWGRQLPVLCPAGFVCISLGLSMPVLLCPQGYYCGEGVRTLDPADETEFRPIPCAAQVFCLGGVAHNSTIDWIPFQPEGQTAPQTCTEGTYCGVASAVASGSGTCFQGHYCPPGVDFPIPTPIGNFASQRGSVAPTMCFPGTYSPLIGMVNCRMCPAGYTCQGYGTYQPEICSNGTYRSTADSVTCRLCPTGTYQPDKGATDISQCLPCPQGRVCGVQGMTTLEQSKDCPAGHACGYGTDRSNQFDHKCPGGHNCPIETTPFEQLDRMCIGGYYCNRGTPDYLALRNKCSLGYYCPPGTASGSQIDTKCPRQTTSLPGVSQIYSCQIADVDVCDKKSSEAISPDLDNSYYPQLTHDLLDDYTTVIFNSLAEEDATGEVLVVEKVYTLNESSSDFGKLWQNDTIEVFRTCLPYMREGGTGFFQKRESEKLQVIGRNFIESGSTYCRFTGCEKSDLGIRMCKNSDGSLGQLSKQKIVVEAEYVSSSRLRCSSTPSYLFDDFQTLNSSFCTMHNNTIAYIGSCTLDDDDCLEANKNLVVTCLSTEVCTNNPQRMMKYNPCITGQILVEASNDGWTWTGDGMLVSAISMFTRDEALLDPNIKRYSDFLDYYVPPSYAILTVISNDVEFEQDMDRTIRDNDYLFCNRSRISEEDDNSGKLSPVTTTTGSRRAKEAGWFQLEALDSAHISIDLSHVLSDNSTNFIYDQHWKIAVFARPSRCDDEVCNSNRVRLPPAERVPCRLPISLPRGLTDPSVPKSQVINLTISALDDAIVKVEIQILHGLYLPIASFLKNSTSVRVSRPSRARATDGIIGGARQMSSYISFAQKRTKKSYFFGIVYKKEAQETISTPLNLPPRYADYERGRVLVSFNSTPESVNTPTILDPYDEVNKENDFWDSPAPIPQESKELQDVYFETFHEMTVEGSEFVYDFQNLLIPYFPFFSNCRGTDSYLFTSEAFESKSECKLPPSVENGGLEPSDWIRYEFPPLPHIDDIDFVGPFELGQSPIADWCERDIVCSYEEYLSEATVVPRWFEAGTGDVLYFIIREPIDYEEYVGRRHAAEVSLKDSGGGATVTDMLQLFGPDIFIQVTVNRDAAELVAGGCDVMCYPRSMTLDISYYQLDERIKRIIYADLYYETFDKTPNSTEYQLHISYYPLSYLELVIAFAYSREVFLSLFVIIGILAIVISSALWLVMRLTTQIDNPPDFKFWGYISLLAPPAAAGVMLAMIPIALGTMFVAILVRGDTLLIDPNIEPGSWILDSYTLHYMDVRVDPENYVRARAGRLGLGFVAMSFYSILASARIFVPRRAGGREKEIEQSRDKRANKLEIWDSSLWKRSNLIFTSYMMSLFCLIIVEFSFWDEFGTYIWYIIIFLKIIDQFVGAQVDKQLCECLLANPINTAEGIAQGYAMLSADDFMDFLLGFFVDFGITLTERCYIDPGLGGFLDWVFNIGKTIKEITVNNLPPWVVTAIGLSEFKAEMEKKKKAKAKAKGAKSSVRGSSTSLSQNKNSHQDSINKASKTSLSQRGSGAGTTNNDAEEEEGDTVEPILDTLGSYSCDAMLTFYNPYTIYLLMIFREESGMPQLYNIKEQDMEYYLWFALIVIPFQFMADSFVNGALELFHGWKIFDYLVYTRYRFLQRETRWKGMEDSLDECIEENLRTLDQLCFSSQYYLAMTIHVNGIVYFFLGVEMMIRSEYNMFGDPAMLVLVPYTVCCCFVIEKLCIWLSMKLSLWRIKHENTAWHAQLGQQDDSTDVPGWNDVAGGMASHESFLINQRITSETFRFKFLNYNRSWVISKLPEMLTPRTLRRSRPYLTNQLQRIITAQNEIAQAKLDEEENIKPVSFGPVALNAASRNILRTWINLAKVRIRLTSLVQPIISRSRGIECESCLSRKQLHVEIEIPMDKMIEQFEATVSKEVELDETAWKAYWLRNQTHHTLCLDCISLKKRKAEADLIAGIGSSIKVEDTKQDYPDWGPVFLTSSSKTMLMSWYKRALTSLAARKGQWKKKVEERNRRLGIVEGDGDEKDGIDQARMRLSTEVSSGNVQLTAPSKAIAIRWARHARARLQKASGFETKQNK